MTAATAAGSASSTSSTSQSWWLAPAVTGIPSRVPKVMTQSAPATTSSVTGFGYRSSVSMPRSARAVITCCSGQQTGRADRERVPGVVGQQGRGDLGASGVVLADEEHLRHPCMPGVGCGGGPGVGQGRQPVGGEVPGQRRQMGAHPGGAGQGRVGLEDHPFHQIGREHPGVPLRQVLGGARQHMSVQGLGRPGGAGGFAHVRSETGLDAVPAVISSHRACTRVSSSAVTPESRSVSRVGTAGQDW